MADQKAQNVILFSTQTCPWCVRAKGYLKQNNVTFKEVLVDRNPMAAQDMIRKSGQMGVPQLWINGTAVVGFNQPRIAQLLGLN